MSQDSPSRISDNYDASESPTKILLNTLQRENQNLQLENLRLQAENNQLKTKVAVLEQEHEQQQKKEEEYKAQHNKELGGLQASINTLSGKCTELQKQNKDLISECADLQQQNKDLRKKNKELENNNRSLKTKVDTLVAITTNHKDNIEILQGKIDQLEEEVRDLKRDKSVAISNLNNQLTEASNLTTDLEAYKQILEEQFDTREFCSEIEKHILADVLKSGTKFGSVADFLYTLKSMDDERHEFAVDCNNKAVGEFSWVKHLRHFNNIMYGNKQHANDFAHKGRPKDRASTAARFINHVFTTTKVATKNDFIEWIMKMI